MQIIQFCDELAFNIAVKFQCIHKNFKAGSVSEPANYPQKFFVIESHHILSRMPLASGDLQPA